MKLYFLIALDVLFQNMYVYVRLEHCSIFEYASKVGVLVLFLEGKEKCFFASSSANTRPIAKPMILIDRG